MELLAEFAGVAREAAVVAALAVFAWVARRALDWLGLDRDDARRAALDQGIRAAIALGAEHLRREGHDLADSVARDNLVRRAAGHVINGFPDAVRHFDLTTAHLNDMVTARLEAVLGPPQPRTKETE